MGGEPEWDRLVLVATSAWLLPSAPTQPIGGPRRRVSALKCEACVHPGEETGAPTPPGGRPTRRGREPAQMLAAVDRHESVLRSMLEPNQPGHSFVSRAADPNPRYAMQARAVPLPWREFAGGADADPVIESVLGRLERHLGVTAEDWMHEEPFVLRHRVIMDRARFEAVTLFVPPEPTDLDYFVTVDFRFIRSAERYQRWHVSIVIWSELPFGVEHRPSLDDRNRWRVREADDVVLRRRPQHYRDLFEACARHAEAWLEGRGYEHSHLHISGRRYMQPDFWIAVPSVRTSPDRYLAADHMLSAEMTRTMLRVDSMFDDTLSVSVLNGDYLVLRQMTTGIEGERRSDRRFHVSRHPLYLIIVGNAPWFVSTASFHVDDRYTPTTGAAGRECANHHRCRRYEYVARQEFCMRDLVDALTDMETFATYTLYEVHNDMQVWENHLRVYETTAAAAGRLWDALATHLPIRRMRQLGKVHHAVELMHQTLLQGIADLNDLDTLAQDCRARVHRARDTLNDRFDDVLLQRQLGTSKAGLRQALGETGVFAQLTSAAANLVEHAGRVTERYQDVINAVKDAFDERRVREGDAIQKAGVILALSLAFDSIVGIISTTQPERSGEQGAWLSVVTWVSGSIVFLAALIFSVWIMRLGRLGDRAFRIRYDGTRRRGLRSFRRNIRTDGLWRFMKNASTDALEGHRRDNPPAEFWRQLDERLVVDLCSLWDQPRAGQRPLVRKPADPFTPAHRPDLVGADITQLYAQVGSWSIDALLFTERTRRLYRYHLPKLTLLYRCIARMPGSFLCLEHLAPATNIVSAAELDMVIRRYARDTGAPPHRPDGTEIGQSIDRELRARRPQTATQAAEAIDELLEQFVPTVQSRLFRSPRRQELGAG